MLEQKKSRGKPQDFVTYLCNKTYKQVCLTKIQLKVSKFFSKKGTYLFEEKGRDVDHPGSDCRVW